MVALWLVLALSGFQMTKDAAVELATEALARHLGLGADRVHVRRVTAVDWPDSSLGCPKEGGSYLQIITSGYLVTAQADAQVYSVHVGDGRAVVCGKTLRAVEGAVAKESFEPEKPIELPQAQKLRELVIQAREDLAARLTVSPESIDLLEVKEVVWPDAGLGCPQPGRAYPQVTKEGFLIRLRIQKRVYRYHSGQGRAPFLCESPAQEPR